jgi:hypothetical protein
VCRCCGWHELREICCSAAVCVGEDRCEKGMNKRSGKLVVPERMRDDVDSDFLGLLTLRRCLCGEYLLQV